MTKYYLSFDGDINEDEAYDTIEDADRAKKKLIREQCQEDALYGQYSKRREARYWAITGIVPREE